MGLVYGIDIHGTLAARQPDGTQEPSTLFPLLEPLMRAWVALGEKVYIVSGPPKDVIEAEVEALGLKQGVHYHELLSVVDFLKADGVPMREDPPGSNHWWCDGEAWDDTKGQMAMEYGIDVIIDDQIEYAAAVQPPTQFVHVKAELLNPDVDQFKAAAAKMLGT